MPHLAVERITKSYDGNPAVQVIAFEAPLAACWRSAARTAPVSPR